MNLLQITSDGDFRRLAYHTDRVTYFDFIIIIKPGSHLRYNDITGRSRKRKKYLLLMLYVSSVNSTS